MTRKFEVQLNPDSASMNGLKVEEKVGNASSSGRESSEAGILDLLGPGGVGKSQLYVHTILHDEKNNSRDDVVRANMASNSARVFIWSSRGGQGHVGMILKDDLNNYHHVSLYVDIPATDNRCEQVLCPYPAIFADGYFAPPERLRGVFDYPRLENRHPNHAVDVKNLNVQAMLTYYHEYKNSTNERGEATARWRQLGNCCCSDRYHNCSSICYEMLVKGGLKTKYSNNTLTGYVGFKHNYLDNPLLQLHRDIFKNLGKGAAVFGILFILFHFLLGKEILGKNNASSDDQLGYSGVVLGSMAILLGLSVLGSCLKRLLCTQTDSITSPWGLKSLLLEGANNRNVAEIELVAVANTLNDTVVVAVKPQA